MKLKQMRRTKLERSLRIEEVLNHIYDGTKLPDAVFAFNLRLKNRVGDDCGFGGSAMSCLVRHYSS
jgi:hypothetical protein